MESPYRTAGDVQTICTAGRADQRCSEARPWNGCRAFRRGAATLALLGAVAAIAFGAGRIAVESSGLMAVARLSTVALPPRLPAPPIRGTEPVRPSPAFPAEAVARTEFALPWPPSIVASTLPATHDANALLQRSRTLIAAGHDLTLTQVTVPRPVIAKEASELSSFRAHVVPVVQRGRPAGVELAWIPHDSLLARVGLRQGDVVTSVNGFPPTDPQWFDALTFAQGRALIEVVRDQRRLALFVSWNE